MDNKTISVYNKRRVQNAIKLYNKRAKKPVNIYEEYGDWNGYTKPVVDKRITKVDLRRMTKSKRLASYMRELNELKSDYDFLSHREKQRLYKENTITRKNQVESIIDLIQESLDFNKIEITLSSYYFDDKKVLKRVLERFQGITFEGRCIYTFDLKGYRRKQKIKAAFA